MTDQESKSLKRYVVWGLLGLIILIGASIATSVVLFVSRSPATFYPFFPFFPFHFGCEPTTAPDLKHDMKHIIAEGEIYSSI